MQIEEGYQLRSRCHLVPTAPANFEWIGTVASAETKAESRPLDPKLMKEAVQELYAEAKSLGLEWEENPITLTPEDKLVKLVQASDESTETED